MTSASRTRAPRLPLSVALRWSIGLSVLMTVLLLTIMSVRMAAGADPALGPKVVKERSAASQQPAATQSQTAAVPSQAVSPSVAVPAQQAAPAQVAPVAPVQTSSS